MRSYIRIADMDARCCRAGSSSPTAAPPPVASGPTLRGPRRRSAPSRDGRLRDALHGHGRAGRGRDRPASDDDGHRTSTATTSSARASAFSRSAGRRRADVQRLPWARRHLPRRGRQPASRFTQSGAVRRPATAACRRTYTILLHSGDRSAIATSASGPTARSWSEIGARLRCRTTDRDRLPGQRRGASQCVANSDAPIRARSNGTVTIHTRRDVVRRDPAASSIRSCPSDDPIPTLGEWRPDPRRRCCSPSPRRAVLPGASPAGNACARRINETAARGPPSSFAAANASV